MKMKKLQDHLKETININEYMYSILDENKEYIFEDTEGAFNLRTQDIDMLFNATPVLQTRANELGEETKVELIKLIGDIADRQDDDIELVYSNKAKYFKVPYDYYQDIKELVNEKYSKYFNIKSDDPISLKLKIGFNKNGKSVEIFETGRGSKSVTTAQQERATCLVWNEFIKTINSGTGKQFDIDNKELVKEIVKDISTDFDSGWITTFQKQIKLVTDYLKSINKEPTKYLMDRSGEGEVGEAYGNFIGTYAKALGGRKDNFDPSDSVIFDINKKKNIISWFKSAASKLKGLNQENNADEIANIKKEYCKEMFESKQFIGISLKKIMGASNTGIYEVFNETDDEKQNKIQNISSYKITHQNTPAAKYLEIECFGNFNFMGITDGDEVVGKEKSIKLVLRSFGSGIIAMDTKLQKGPSLGKCPIRVWSKAIGANNTKDITDCLETFNTWLKKSKDSDIKKTLKIIIQGSIKEGGECLPFVLLH